MKRKYCIITLMTLLMVTAITASTFAADEWGMFRRDRQRTGATDPDVLQSNRLRPIWVYPAAISGLAPIDNDYGSTNVVEFEAYPMGTERQQWKESSPDVTKHAPNAYNDNYLYIETAYSETEQYEKWYGGSSPKPYASWTLDAREWSRSASFYIYVWFPSSAPQEYPYARTMDAHYVVEDIVRNSLGEITSRTVLGRFTLNQNGGETWLNLGTDPFEAKAGHQLVVTLTNETQNSSTSPQRIVVADAVRFTQDTGTVLSSPVLSQIETQDPILLSSPIYVRPLGAITGQDSSRDVGVVNGLHTENDMTTPVDDRGLPSWVFPENNNNWIQNGITSTPAITMWNGEEAAVVPASDGQIYVIRTAHDTGGLPRLICQGPGYTLNDPTSFTGNDWELVTTEPGYQGDGFHRTRAVYTTNPEGSNNAAWKQTGIAGGEYAIYVWIPPSTTTNLLYTYVNYRIDITGNTTPTNVYISQRNGGQWVKLGTFSIPSGGTVTVTLNNRNGPGTGQDAQYVAADALKIVPSDLGAFELSSPVIDQDGGIYVGGENGRVYKFNVGSDMHIPEWVYPDPNISPSITDPTNVRYPAPNSVGSFYASPSLSPDEETLYVGSLDGYVYAIRTDNGTRKWRYPDATDTTRNLGEISSTAAVGEYIYVAIGGVGSGFPYDTSGRVVALKDNGSSASPQWWYPSSPETSYINRGEFMYSSPLLITRPGDADPSIYVGSTDGYFYGMNAKDGTALQNRYEGILSWNPTNLVDIINSSPAGTLIQPGFVRRGTMAPSVDRVPYALVGSDNNALYGIDLRDGYKDWYWNMLGPVFASPIIAKERVYASDCAGYTWAFTSRPGAEGGGGGEEWNPEAGAAPPTGGSETGETENELIDVDIYPKAVWDTWTLTANPHLHSISDEDAIFEWGETIYFVVWNIKSPASKIQVSLKSRGGGRAANAGSEPITVPATAIMSIPSPDGEGNVFYAKYQYVLDGSNSGRAVTPGERVSMDVIEIASVNGIEQQIGQAFVPNKESGATGDKTKFVPRDLRINNPLGFIYEDSMEGYAVGVKTTGTTSKNEDMAAMNGNFFDPQTRKVDLRPYLRSQTGTAHGMISPPRVNIIVDRSLMGAFGRQLTNCRVDFTDFNWVGPFPDTLLPWEMPPVLGPWNKSTDYPNIPDYQGVSKVAATGIDPSKISVGLVGTDRITSDTAPSSWRVGRNPMSFAVNVPRFQPANCPKDLTSNNNDVWRSTGYTGRVRVYIDSNNNGRYNSAWSQGAWALRKRGRAGASNRTEAFREFFLQAHVLPDRHLTIAEKTIDIGQVAHGFGMVKDNAASIPVSFHNNLYDNIADWDPENNAWGFGEWFKEFTAYNEGNVNLVNLRAYQPYLFSDTVSELYGIRGMEGKAEPGERIPYAHTVTSLDPVFLDDGPGVSPMYPSILKSRTFHKAKVGDEEPTQLKIPDMPENKYITQFQIENGRLPDEDEMQKLPRLSISVPIGQPAGTYYGRFTMYDDINDNGEFDDGESVGDSNVNLTINVSESRMTAGSMRGVIPQIDKDGDENVGDMHPAAYRDPISGDVCMFWSSNRYGMENTGRSDSTPYATDPWYLYVSTLPWSIDDQQWVFNVDSPLPGTRWWRPTGPEGASNAATPFPPSSYLDAGDPKSFFPGPTSAFPNLGAPGDTRMDTVKFYNPSVTVDPITKRSWLFFLGQAYKTEISTPETRSYFTEITGESLSADKVYDTDRPTPDSDRNIDGDWTTPKYGIRGLATHMKRIDDDPSNNLFLWSFWYGGSNGKWRIFYNANIDPGADNGKGKWTNNATLPMPQSLVYMAEPAPIYKDYNYWDKENNSPYMDFIDVVYSGFSSFHKNSDIYLSRYQPNDEPDTKSGAIKMYGNAAWRLPMRGADYFFDDSGNNWHDKASNELGYIPFAALKRSPTSAVWYSDDTDWDPLAGFRVMIFMNVKTGTVSDWTWYELTTSDGVRDPKTGVWVYNYAKDQTLRKLFRGIIVDPAAGTVKFLRSPGKNALVVANFTPGAYRLTTDTATDDSPFVIMDRDGNPRYLRGNTSGNPFYVPSSWDVDVRPPTDRLWLFWRRPGMDKPGTGIYYKTYRYGIKLSSQIAVDEDTGAPQLLSVEPVSVPDGGWRLHAPVEVDWAKNHLYFSSADEGNLVEISYKDSNNKTVNVLGTVELIEELGPSKEGSVFGNLTQLMVNEGQISAFKDRVENDDGNILEDRVWAFWTSTRSGNTDIYYETISPRFFGASY